MICAPSTTLGCRFLFKTFYAHKAARLAAGATTASASPLGDAIVFKKVCKDLIKAPHSTSGVTEMLPLPSVTPAQVLRHVSIHAPFSYGKHDMVAQQSMP